MFIFHESLPLRLDEKDEENESHKADSHQYYMREGYHREKCPLILVRWISWLYTLYIITYGSHSIYIYIYIYLYIYIYILLIIVDILLLLVLLLVLLLLVLLLSFSITMLLIFSYLLRKYLFIDFVYSI